MLALFEMYAWKQSSRFNRVLNNKILAVSRERYVEMADTSLEKGGGYFAGPLGPTG